MALFSWGKGQGWGPGRRGGVVSTGFWRRRVRPPPLSMPAFFSGSRVGAFGGLEGEEGFMKEENWQSEELKDLDLKLENQSLEMEIKLKGGIHSTQDDIDPKLHNVFLKNVLAFEQASEEPELSMRSLFPKDYEFPPPLSMSPERLSAKLKEMEQILFRHNVQFGFSKNLPGQVLYKYLVEEVIPNETVTAATQAGFTWVLDGCGGDCESCFQKPYCSTALDSEEEDPFREGEVP
jgi:hypothetical protein